MGKLTIREKDHQANRGQLYGKTVMDPKYPFADHEAGRCTWIPRSSWTRQRRRDLDGPLRGPTPRKVAPESAALE